MKNKITVLVFILFATLAFAQEKNKKITMEVDGKCDMCKERIEKACIKTKGVKSAVWNVKTHELNLIFDERKTNEQTIKNKIASVSRIQIH